MASNMICVLSPNSARKNAIAVVITGPNRPSSRIRSASSAVSSASSLSPRSVQTPNPTNSRPETHAMAFLGIAEPISCPTSTVREKATSVERKMPRSTCQAL